MTYKEIVYMCLDTLKITSDDSIFNEDHILFLINRYRSILLQQKYADIRNPVSTSNYQTLCLDLTLDNTKSIDICKDTVLRSTEKIPSLLNIGNKEAAPILLDSLQILEYRGYDSAGVAVLNNNSIINIKAKGKV